MFWQLEIGMGTRYRYRYQIGKTYHIEKVKYHIAKIKDMNKIDLIAILTSQLEGISLFIIKFPEALGA